MKLTLKTATAVCALALAFSASAAKADGWSGAYLGVNLGLAHTSVDATASVPGFSVSGSGSDTKFTGGFIGGYNWQSGNQVFGIEGDINFLSDWDYLGSIRGRYGIIHNSWLYYGTAGVGFVSSGGSVSTPFGNYNGYSTAGFVIGAGAETKISPNLTFGLEGLYYAFPDDRQNIGGVDLKTSADVLSVRARLTYRLGSSYEALK